VLPSGSSNQADLAMPAERALRFIGRARRIR
jgi:hypothetical protein